MRENGNLIRENRNKVKQSKKKPDISSGFFFFFFEILCLIPFWISCFFLKNRYNILKIKSFIP